jgi:peroxiredoxin
MALAAELSAIDANLKENAPPAIVDTIVAVKTNFQKSFNRSAAIKVGDTLPPFNLTNAVGQEVSSASLLSKGPLLITFYRGEWCPYCNLALRSLQSQLPAFQSKGVTLVAISPELPNTSLTTKEKHDLQFEVLSDVGNEYTKKLGLLFQQPDELRPIFEKIGHDLKSRNGDDSFAVPVPATLLVDKEGKVRNSFVEPDWTRRLETSEALEWVDKL